MMENIQKFQPTHSTNRIELIDALRGFALLGVLLMNMLTFSGYVWLIEPQKQALSNYEWNRMVEAGLMILVNTKFITIFSILFGVGFALQEQRAAFRKISFTSFFGRRMFWLLVIGGIHAYGFWFGDILRSYAICGLLLLLIRTWSDRGILRLSLFFFVFMTAIVFIINGVVFSGGGDPAAEMAFLERIVTTFAGGSYWEVLQVNFLIDPFYNFLKDCPLTFVATFGKFLLGYWMGRKGILANPIQFKTLLKKWFWWGLGIGVPGSITFWALNAGLFDLDQLWLIWLPFALAGALVLHSLFYISGFIYLFQTRIGQRILSIFIPVGKMALSNYVGQTLICLFLFYGFMPGGAWLGKVGVTTSLLLSLSIFILQILVSTLWLNWRVQGPLEWVWRRLVYANFSKNSLA